MPQIGTPKINFYFESSQSPKDFIVVDISEWRAIQNRPATIAITVPGSSQPVIYPLVKNTFNVFNSNNLYQGCYECEYTDLPDGIYFVEITSTTPYNLSKYYLKTDLTRLHLDEMYIRVGFDFTSSSESLIKALSKIEAYLKVAEAHTRRGDINLAQRYFQEAQNLIENNCKTCH